MTNDEFYSRHPSLAFRRLPGLPRPTPTLVSPARRRTGQAGTCQSCPAGVPVEGRVYVSWHDGRNASNAEPFSLTGAPTYNFADVLVSSSADGGVTWTAPVRVNQDPTTNRVDHLFPALAVDREGQVGVLYYDRRNDPQNFIIDVFLATSNDGGQTWQEMRLNRRGFPSEVAQDLLVDPAYMGDYLGLSADASGSTGGFVASWGDNSRGHPAFQISRGGPSIPKAGSAANL